MKRIKHIDNAKAIGIMLIIMSHIGVDRELNESFLFSTFDDIINSFSDSPQTHLIFLVY